jgi:hypothetical protein
MSPKTIWLVVVLLVVCSYPLTAGTYYVGTCHAGSFPTIMAAVTSSSVAAGSTINVCPGLYSEQVIISKPLTLQGIEGGGSATIYGAAATNPSYTESAVFEVNLIPSVWVTTGPVNIQDISVIFAVYGADAGCPSFQQAGFYYASGAYGTLKRVQAYEVGISELPDGEAETFNCPGYGIWVENGNSNPTSVTISNSFSNTGILAAALESLPVRLTVSITGNTTFPVSGQAGVDAGIYVSQVAGVVSHNFIQPRREEGQYIGILDDAPNATISDNAIVGNDDADADGGLYFSGTRGYGIVIQSNDNGAIVKSNTIIGVLNAIDVGCNSATVTGNTITLANTGLLDVPSTFAGVNHFYATGQEIQHSCP